MADEQMRGTPAGRLVSASNPPRRVSKVAGGRARSSAAGRSAAAGHFASGARVRVRFGAADHPAVVLEQRGDRVRVGIDLDGVEEQIVSTYPTDEVQPA